MKPLLDEFEQIACCAKYPVAILANTLKRDIELIDLANAPSVPELYTLAEGRGLCFLAAVGLVDGVPMSALAAPLDDDMTKLMTSAYLEYVHEKQRQRVMDLIPPDAAQDYLCRLWSLSDPRHNRTDA
ncbi:hypothetical protein [Terriglobus albidus]|uniref:hypothetical protein n=1 Tax=Terriglobus albidus TaxID=1592106 RepID=UPI0021E0B6BF|nr:hypothetical protein [Terriglobus albidus]